MGRRDAVPALLYAADGRDLGGDFGRQQHAALPGFGALTELNLNHLDLRQGGFARELDRIKAAFDRPAAEIATGDLPDQVTAAGQVIGRNTALAGVVRKRAQACTGVERLYGRWRKRTK